MKIPNNLLYSSDHEWVLVEGEEAVIGITFFAQAELGDIVYVDIVSPNKALQARQTFGTIEAVKTVSDLYVPISGEIIQINQQVEDHAELVNMDPYGEGWMIRLKITQPEELESLLSPEQYEALTVTD